MQVKKMQQPHDGIKCEAHACRYNMTGEYCCAEKIEIKPVNATSIKETGCATFTMNS